VPSQGLLPGAPALAGCPRVWSPAKWASCSRGVSLPSTGMNALQLQNLATLAAAAAAAQTSATTTNANPLSTTSSALGALTSPGKGVPSLWGRGEGGAQRRLRASGVGGLDPCEVS